MNQFNKKEFESLCHKFNREACIKEITINYTENSFFDKMKHSIEKDRRGEVVFCVIRPNGKVIAVTCSEYPEGIYRIPTGGIGYGEDIVEAVFREVKEELGIDAVIDRFLGVLKIKFQCDEESVMFYSYIFILKETGGRLLVDASDDEVSGIQEVDAEGLRALVDSLANIEGRWSNWGKFRLVTSHAVLEYLQSTVFENKVRFFGDSCI